jgi:hypothetical protein
VFEDARTQSRPRPTHTFVECYGEHSSANDREPQRDEDHYEYQVRCDGLHTFALLRDKTNSADLEQPYQPSPDSRSAVPDIKFCRIFGTTARVALDSRPTQNSAISSSSIPPVSSSGVRLAGKDAPQSCTEPVGQARHADPTGFHGWLWLSAPPQNDAIRFTEPQTRFLVSMEVRNTQNSLTSPEKKSTQGKTYREL